MISEFGFGISDFVISEFGFGISDLMISEFGFVISDFGISDLIIPNSKIRNPKFYNPSSITLLNNMG